MFELSDKPISVTARPGRACGAHVVFEGVVRDHNDGRQVLRLEYEAMESVAVKEGKKIGDEAKQRFGVNNVHCVHRVGALEIGDTAVVVTVSAAHRGEAFMACQYVIDEVKRRVPIWKREHYADGTTEWVNAAEVQRKDGPAVLIDSPEALDEWTIIDVRDADEIEEEPISAFQHLVSNYLAFDRSLVANGKALLVCASGIRALILADDLRREGYADVWSLTGGCKTLRLLAKRL